VCGLVGIFDGTGRREVEQRLLERMNGTLRHRGPDGEGYHLEPGLGLGHQRLAIIDIAGGAQPMYSADRRRVVVFNGEIYNFRQLRRELEGKGHRFRTESDTEVILQAYSAWGAAGVERLGGMFAFALWDPNTETLLLARDRLGKKPLYYAPLADGTLLFGSELKALLRHPGVDRTALNPAAVEDFFAYGYVPDPKTILNGVFKLPPAHFLTQRRGEAAEIKAYWDVRFASSAADEGQAQEALIGRLREAVQERLVADVPLGAFLSGGVDSGAVVAMMAGLDSSPIKSFAIGFADRRFDESDYAQSVATRYGTEHLRETLGPGEMIGLERLAAVFDEPFGDASALPTYRVAELARRRVTVCLSGDGGDEVFAGYRRYLWHLREAQARALLPARLRRPLFAALARCYPKLDRAPRVLRAKTTLHELALEADEAYVNSVSVTTAEMRRQLFSSGMRRDLAGYRADEVVRAELRRADTDDPLRQAQYADLKTYLAGDILVKVDRASMAHSLEVRAPFLDHELVEWALNLPSPWKLRGSQGKRILKRALEPYLPHEVLYRPKMGFSPPLAAWLRGPLRPKLQALAEGGDEPWRRLFNPDVVAGWIKAHGSGRRDYSAALWLLLVFDASMRRLAAGSGAG